MRGHVHKADGCVVKNRQWENRPNYLKTRMDVAVSLNVYNEIENIMHVRHKHVSFN